MPYQSDIECKNCGLEGSVEMPEGLRVLEMPCPECHTKSLTVKSKAKTEGPKEDSGQ